MTLTEGTPAPSFSLPDQTGQIHTLDDYRGQWLLIYFYPKDDTPGCTKEACGFRDLQSELKEHNCAVLGVSKDSMASHQKFTDKYDLNFPLLADESTEMIQAYGAWDNGTKRISVLIDPQGNIDQMYTKVDTDRHAQEVLNKLKS